MYVSNRIIKYFANDSTNPGTQNWKNVERIVMIVNDDEKETLHVLIKIG
jgi:hypothetical protein